MFQVAIIDIFLNNIKIIIKKRLQKRNRYLYFYFKIFNFINILTYNATKKINVTFTNLTLKIEFVLNF